MNFKKLKLWKLLAVSGVVGLVATVPIITTACSSTTEDVRAIELNDEIKQSTPLIVKGSFSELVKIEGNDKKLSTQKLLDNLAKKINKDDKLKESFIKNYDSISESIGSINLIPKDGDDIGVWGTDSSWIDANNEKNPKIAAYYHFDLQRLTISSITDLKNKLSPNDVLKDIMKVSLDADEFNKYESFSFVEGSALLVDNDNDYLRMHVDAKKGNVSTYIELRIPVSDINYEPSGIKVEIASKNNNIEKLNPTPTYIKYLVGVDEKPHPNTVENKNWTEETIEGSNAKQLTTNLSGNLLGTSTKDGYGKVTAENLAKKLEWYTTPKQEAKDIKNNDESLTLEGENINNHNVAKSLHIFNVDFTRLTLTPSDGKPTDSYVNGYTGKFNIELKGKPSKGYYWNDGTDNERTINVDNLQINLDDAEINREIALTKEGASGSETWSYTIKNINDFPNSQDQNQINAWLQNADNIKKLEDEINSEAAKQPQSGAQNQKKNIGVRYKITAKTRYSQPSLRTSNTKNAQAVIVSCQIILSDGHKFKDIAQDNEIKQPFDLTIKPKA